MREIGFGDTTINKNMRFLVKTFYNILFNCEKYKKMTSDDKNRFFIEYFELNNIKNNIINKGIIDKSSIIETLTGFKRAGANAVITYFANKIAKDLK